MNRKTRLISLFVLIILLLAVPVAVMAIMGFDHYDANEFLIISIALSADIGVFLAYRFWKRRLADQ